MNELETALLIRRALDKGTERLSYKTVHRLESARKLALGRMGKAQADTTFSEINTAGSSLTLSAKRGQMGWWGTFATTVAPVALVVAGLFATSMWSDKQRAEEVAEVDSAMLTDDLPIALYADRGFGVFIKNTNQQ
jgi:uncharacterized iron-regulated membrane protein